MCRATAWARACLAGDGWHTAYGRVWVSKKVSNWLAGWWLTALETLDWANRKVALKQAQYLPLPVLPVGQRWRAAMEPVKGHGPMMLTSGGRSPRPGYPGSGAGRQTAAIP